MKMKILSMHGNFACSFHDKTHKRLKLINVVFTSKTPTKLHHHRRSSHPLPELNIQRCWITTSWLLSTSSLCVRYILCHSQLKMNSNLITTRRNWKLVLLPCTSCGFLMTFATSFSLSSSSLIVSSFSSTWKRQKLCLINEAMSPWCPRNVVPHLQ